LIERRFYVAQMDLARRISLAENLQLRCPDTRLSADNCVVSGVDRLRADGGQKVCNHERRAFGRLHRTAGKEMVYFKGANHVAGVAKRLRNNLTSGEASHDVAAREHAHVLMRHP